MSTYSWSSKLVLRRLIEFTQILNADSAFSMTRRQEAARPRRSLLSVRPCSW
jgi:hypothetical protein